MSLTHPFRPTEHDSPNVTDTKVNAAHGLVAIDWLGSRGKSPRVTVMTREAAAKLVADLARGLASS